jgi:hypothetical protein
MRIGELAERSGATARSVRYYFDVGLIGSVRTTCTIASVLPCTSHPGLQPAPVPQIMVDE